VGVVEGGCPTLTSGGWVSSTHHSHIWKREYALLCKESKARAYDCPVSA